MNVIVFCSSLALIAFLNSCTDEPSLLMDLVLNACTMAIPYRFVSKRVVIAATRAVFSAFMQDALRETMSPV
jgi:hypothetical protein